jgi:hypothetical protein
MIQFSADSICSCFACSWPAVTSPLCGIFGDELPLHSEKSNDTVSNDTAVQITARSLHHGTHAEGLE